ncbi:MAG: GTP-binding protein [Planctomycetales bacterium]|nr:GTP-binding protein [Planctomycetales bacterium]
MSELRFKLCLLGAFAVGKTSLVRRFVDGIYDDDYHTTIGVKIDRHRTTVSDREVHLLIWDVAGAEDTFSVPSSYVAGAAGYLLVVDGTRADTLSTAASLVEQVRHDVGPIPFIVLLNKSDLIGEWEISADAIPEVISRHAVDILQTSAKTGDHVSEAFERLARTMAEA